MQVFALPVLSRPIMGRRTARGNRGRTICPALGRRRTRFPSPLVGEGGSREARAG
jgi:hypothetical protein